MANLTAKKDARHQPGQVLPYKLNNIKVWEGALLALNTSGYAVKASDAANEQIIGIADETVDNSAGAAGDKEVRVRPTGVADLTARFAAAQADVGKKVYAFDDQTVDLAANLTNDVLVGRIVEVVSSTKLRVAITPWV